MNARQGLRLGHMFFAFFNSLEISKFCGTCEAEETMIRSGCSLVPMSDSPFSKSLVSYVVIRIGFPLLVLGCVEENSLETSKSHRANGAFISR